MGSPGVGHSMSHGLLGLNHDPAEYRTRQNETQPAANGRRTLGATFGLADSGFGRRNGRWSSKTSSINSEGTFLRAAPTPCSSSWVARPSGTSSRSARFSHSSSLSRRSRSASRRRRSFRIKVWDISMGNLGTQRWDRHRQGREPRYIRPGFTFPQAGAQGPPGQPPSECLQLPSPSTVYPFQPLHCSS